LLVIDRYDDGVGQHNHAGAVFPKGLAPAAGEEQGEGRAQGYGGSGDPVHGSLLPRRTGASFACTIGEARVFWQAF
jgi:hypothetical protein